MSKELVKAWYKAKCDVTIEPTPVGILMGCTLWGEPYTTYFLRYCMPSIMSKWNRRTLEDAKWEVVLYVDEPTKHKLLQEMARSSPAITVPHGSLADVPLRLREIPPEIMVALKKDANLKFTLLAAVQNLLVHEAGIRGGGFHMLMPDHTYSKKYFPNLARISNKYGAISQTTLASSAAALCPILDTFRKADGTISIDATSLGTHGYATMTDQWRSWAMSKDVDLMDLPDTDFIFWRTKDAVRMHCAHQNAMWISPDRCRAAYIGVGGTIDSELPKYMRGQAYVPTLEDDMAFIALADTDASVVAPRVFGPDFKQHFWDNIAGSDVFISYYMMPCWLPVSRDDSFPSAEEVQSAFQRLMVMLGEP